MKIFRNAIEIYDLEIDGRSQLSQRLMGEDLITIDVTVDSKLDVQIGDYVTYGGINYTINRPVLERKVSEVEYMYSFQFEGPYYELLDKKLMLAGKAEFRLTGYLTDFVDLIVSNINEIHSGWSKGAVVASDWKNVYFSGKNCKEALEQLANEFSVEFSIVGKTINLVERVETVTGLTFEHGKGKGLYELSKGNVDDGNTVTRVHAFGSTRNLPFDYRGGVGRLVFQNLDGTRYLENTSQYSRIIEQIVTFENIWPRFEGAISAVSADKKTFTCPDIDFDLNAQLLPGITAKVVFLDGDLMGSQFEVSSFNNTTKQVSLVSSTSAGGLVMPSLDTFYQAPGDRFVFVDIKMPQSYVDAAEAKLKAAAQAYLNYFSKLRIKFSLKLDHRYIRDNNITLKVGDVVRVVSTRSGIDEQIRVTSIRRNLDGSGITADISNFIEERFSKQVTNQLNDTLAALTSVQSSVERQTIITSVTKGARVWGGTEAKRIDELSPVIPDSGYAIEVDKSGLAQSAKVSLSHFWLKSELIESGGYLYHDSTKIKSGYADNSGLLNGLADSQFLRRDVAQTVSATTDWLDQLSGLYGFKAGLAGESYLEMLDGLVALKKNVGSEAYASGFSGHGWRIDPADNRLTVDNLTVRKEMSVYELVINQIRGTNGALWVSDSAKVSGVSGNRLTIDTGGSSTLVPFVANDIIRCQRWTGSNIKYYVARVTAVGSNYIDVLKTDGASSFEVGDEIVRIGNTTNTSRQGAIYLTSSDNNAPYLDVLDGVVSSSLTGKTKVRLGKLDGITDADLGVLSGYGLYSENAYLKGKIVVTGGNAETLTGSQAKADAAQQAAETYALAKANLAETQANAYADGVASAAEQAAINAAQAKADAAEVAAKAYADGIVTTSEQAAIDAAKAYADAQDVVYETTVKAYADGIVSDEEARAIADAQAKADAARIAAINAAAADATDKIDSLEISFENLINTSNPANIHGFGSWDTSPINYIFSLNNVTTNGFFFDDDVVEIGNSYVLKFKLRRTGGSLDKVGGHSSSYTINYVKIDNVNIGTGWSSPKSVTTFNSNTDWHDVEVSFNKINPGAFYVQVNRSTYQEVSYQLKDLQLVKGAKIGDWAPSLRDVEAYADTQAAAAQSSAEGYASGLVNALSGSLGGMAYQDVVNIAKLDSTIIQGGYIKSSLLDVSAIKVSGGFASLSEAQAYADNAMVAANDYTNQVSALKTFAVVDATALSQDHYYPLIVKLTSTPYTMTIRRTLASSYGVPSYATHGNGFSLVCKWTSMGSGWGTIPIQRTIHEYQYGWCTHFPVGSIGQLSNSSEEYIMVRGGSKYNVEVEGTSNAPISLKTGSYESTYGQTIEVASSVTRPVVTMKDLADSAKNAAQSYADGLAATLQAEKQDAIINGQTLIIGGYINTAFIEADSITADKIIFDGATGNNVTLSGTINAASGTIGGFEISNSGIVNNDGTSYVVCRNLNDGRDARIGSSVFPLSGSGVTYFRNEYNNPYATNYAVYAKARNPGAQYAGIKGYYAGKFDGHVRIDNGDFEVDGQMAGKLNIPDDQVTSMGNGSSDNYLSSGYNLFTGDTKTGNRTYYLPLASSYKAGEVIRIVNWNDQDAYIKPRAGDTINGYTVTQKYITLHDASSSCALRSNGSNQWMILYLAGTGVAF